MVIARAGLTPGPGMLQIRYKFKPLRIVTHSTLVRYTAFGGTAFPALRIESKIEGTERGVEISLLPRHLNWRVVFDGISLDEHGVTAAAIHLLLRAFRWKEGQRVLSWEEMSVWELLDRRSPEEDNRDLWVIAHWQDWNVAGILWDDRFYRALKDGIFPRDTTFDAFKKRYERMPLGPLVVVHANEYDKSHFEFVLDFLLARSRERV